LYNLRSLPSISSWVLMPGVNITGIQTSYAYITIEITLTYTTLTRVLRPVHIGLHGDSGRSKWVEPEYP
jgi:hypothetical protein